MPSRIEDYALIGDCQTAALVAKDGSIDWLCFPRFDSGACFAALLGTPDNGRWLIAPAGEIQQVRRRYRPGTLILETEYQTAEGTVTLIDFMPPRSSAPDLIRIVEGHSGRVRMKFELIIRFDYGSVVPWVRALPGRRGVRATAGPDTLFCRAEVPLHGQNLRTVAEFDVSAGQKPAFELVWSHTHAATPRGQDSHEALRSTESWCRQWSDRCTYEGGWTEAVKRSLITLKALTYSPTGGIVAAPTTSLPEHLGGVRNWDYRYCWLRDATFTLHALMIGGYHEEAYAWRRWLINAVAGTPADLQIMYGIAGERRLTELQLEWLPGYENSAPVRIGNAAYHQRQHDIFGEIMGALHLGLRAGLPRNDEAWRIQREMMHYLLSAWKEPDEGIWEIRGPKRHYTHSKVMAWLAFDRAIKIIEQFGGKGEIDRWRTARQEAHEQVLREGFNPRMNAFTQYYGSDDADASLLMLPLVGFIPATDPRMLGTVELVQKQLKQDGFIARYVAHPRIDGLPPGEGAFLLCTFWLADNLALQGRREEAREIFERLLTLRNDVGLLSEEYDPRSKRLIGNFPQAFSHVGLINTARNLNEAAKGSVESLVLD